MKTISFLFIISFCSLFLNAQETYFASKEGMILTYKNFDKKDKMTSKVQYTIKDVNINGTDMDITYVCESYDNKEKLVYKEDILIHQKGDILYFDMSNFVNKSAFQQNGEIPAEVDIKGNNMQIPLNPKQGDMLADASIEMSMKMGIINMKFSANITNRKVEGFENVGVSAGSFECCKITEDVNTVAMAIKMNTQSNEWFAKGVGLVKSETFNKKGELIGRTELVEISN